jgi:hypothetical protein
LGRGWAEPSVADVRAGCAVVVRSGSNDARRRSPRHARRVVPHDEWGLRGPDIFLVLVAVAEEIDDFHHLDAGKCAVNEIRGCLFDSAPSSFAGLTCRYPVRPAIRPSRACIDECHHAFDVAFRPSWTRHHRPGGPRWRQDPGASPGGAHVPRRPSRRDDPHHDWCSSAQVRTRVHRHHARVRCVQPSRSRSWYTRDAAAAARVSLAPEPRPRPAARVQSALHET